MKFTFFTSDHYFGSFFDHRIHVRIAEPTFRKLVCLLLGAIGILLLWRSGVV